MKELIENLKGLLRQLKNGKTVIRSSAKQNSYILLLYRKKKLYENKDRLKMLFRKKLTNCSKRNNQLFAKKKKPNED